MNCLYPHRWHIPYSRIKWTVFALPPVCILTADQHCRSVQRDKMNCLHFCQSVVNPTSEDMEPHISIITSASLLSTRRPRTWSPTPSSLLLPVCCQPDVRGHGSPTPSSLLLPVCVLIADASLWVLLVRNCVSTSRLHCVPGNLVGRCWLPALSGWLPAWDSWRCGDPDHHSKSTPLLLKTQVHTSHYGSSHHFTMLWRTHACTDTHKPHAHTQITHTLEHRHTHIHTWTHTHEHAHAHLYKHKHTHTYTDLQHPGKFHCPPAWKPGIVALSVWLPSAGVSGPAAQIHLSTQWSVYLQFCQHSDQYIYSSVNTQWSVFLQFCQHSDQYIYSSVNTVISLFTDLSTHSDQYIYSSVNTVVSIFTVLSIPSDQYIYSSVNTQWSVYLQFCQHTVISIFTVLINLFTVLSTQSDQYFYSSVNTLISLFPVLSDFHQQMFQVQLH